MNEQRMVLTHSMVYVFVFLCIVCTYVCRGVAPNQRGHVCGRGALFFCLSFFLSLPPSSSTCFLTPISFIIPYHQTRRDLDIIALHSLQICTS